MNPEITDAFISLQREFYGKPSVSLAPWISIDDDTGQIVVSLLNGYLNRCVDSREEMPLRDNRAYRAIRELVSLAPWCSFFEFIENEDALQIRETISEDDLKQLVEEINGHHQAIERRDGR